MPVGPFSRRKPLRVQPFFGFRNTERLLVNARAMRSREPVFVKRSFWRDFRTMAGIYLSQEVPGLRVDLEYALPDGRVLRQSATTGPEGYVSFGLPLSPGNPTAERTRWEKAVLRWRDSDGNASFETDVWILTSGSQTRVGIISDIDDTILETGVTGGVRSLVRNWKRVMAQMPSDRVPVPGASSLLAALGARQRVTPMWPRPSIPPRRRPAWGRCSMFHPARGTCFPISSPSSASAACRSGR